MIKLKPHYSFVFSAAAIYYISNKSLEFPLEFVKKVVMPFVELLNLDENTHFDEIFSYDKW